MCIAQQPPPQKNSQREQQSHAEQEGVFCDPDVSDLAVSALIAAVLQRTVLT